MAEVPDLSASAADPPDFGRALEEVLVWGVQQSWLMLRRPADIRLTMDGLGFTHPQGPLEPLVIYVNPLVLLEPRGSLLLKGLIVHELGHHEAHFSDPEFRSVNVRARAKNLGSLLNLIDDEHLERRLRSKRVEWGEALDALASYAFRGAPVDLLIESYAALQDRDTAAASEGVLEGALPGVVRGFEWKIRTRENGESVWTKPEFVLRLFEELTTRLQRGGRAPPSDLLSARDALVAKAREWRGHGEGLVEAIVAHPSLKVDGAETGQEWTARRTLGDVLQVQSGEESEAYLDRLRRELSSALKAFPKLERYILELERVRESKWFWDKQRAMLHNLRHGYDFQFTFEPAQSMTLQQLEEALADLPVPLSPGELVRLILAAWMPEPFEDRASPLSIRLSWNEVLASPGTPSLTRFMVSLRLGLGRPGVAGDPRAAAALSSIPKNLKSRSVSELWDVVQKVASILGSEADDQPTEPRNKEDLRSSSSGSPSAVLAEALIGESAKARGSLAIPAPSLSGELMDASKAAIKSASTTVEDWLADTGYGGVPERDPWAGNREPGYDRIRIASRGNVQHRKDLLSVADECDFTPILNVVPAEDAPAEYERLVSQVQREVRVLRRYFQTLGKEDMELGGQVRGHRFDATRAARLAIFGVPDVLVRREERFVPDLFVGVAVDCSSSMAFGDRMDKALSFAVLLMEATRRVPGITARAIGFTDDVILDAGRPASRRVAGFRPSGGNNDSAGLMHLAERALGSGHKNRLLIMISDGFPTECSLQSLTELVHTLDRRFGISCVQVAVAPMDAERVAFPDYTDLTALNLPSAVALFGKMVQRIIHQRLGL